MYDELYQLLILNKELTIPGIGIFSLVRKPAEAHFVEKLVHPPVYSISFQNESGTPTKNFFLHLAELLNSTDREAVVRFNDFVFDLKKRISSGAEVLWNGVGTISMDHSGGVILSAFPCPVIEEPVAVERVLREHAEHTVLVGAQERTSVEMAELLSQTEAKRSKWRIAALITGLVLIAFALLQFSKNEWTIPATSNQQKISPEPLEPSYFTLQ